MLTVPAQSTEFVYIVKVNVSNEYDNLEYRIVCSWLDFGKVQPGRASPPSDVVKPATYCICKLSTLSRLRIYWQYYYSDKEINVLSGVCLVLIHVCQFVCLFAC